MTKRLTTREQDRLVRRHWPTFQTLRRSRTSVCWQGTLLPLGRAYTVLVVLDFRERGLQALPSVVVRDPVLRTRPQLPDEAIPHVYPNPDRRRQQFPSLCLYYPPDREWHDGLAVAKTIIPWSIDWLACYEGWLATGEWLGGGIH